MGLSVIIFLAATVGTLVLGLTFKWVDRKVTAMVQWRVGPPWYQPGVDILKLMGKENTMPDTARGTGFLLAPLIALAGIQLPWLFSGALVTETIFGWPGMGRLFVDALTMKEYPVLMGMVMVTAIAVILGNLLADTVNALLDPRIRVD